MSIHKNDGNCMKCEEIFNRYPGFHQGLKGWFKQVQKAVPEFHCAEAGRGHIEQEKDYAKGASRAWWLESAHNYNVAFDSFFLINGKYDLSESNYAKIIPYLRSSVTWYGSATAKFYERPHYELTGWRVLADRGVIKPVEDYRDVKPT